ncbi:MAG: SMI1/KNR4 family protein [Spirochaetia bacterium]|nr:SMI1/KNR4 family protein [Spirochaetia bacterium]
MISESNISFSGPPVDPNLLADLPEELQYYLKIKNGFIAYDGGLHVRGACAEPSWHSIHSVWKGKLALRQTYDGLSEEAIPFAEDCMGDPFILRSGMVYRLTLETAFMEPLGSMTEFFQAIEKDPQAVLHFEPLLKLKKQGSGLAPGQLIHAYPPYSTEQAANGVILRAVPAEAQIAYELDFFTRIRNLPEGETFRIKILPNEFA